MCFGLHIKKFETNQPWIHVQMNPVIAARRDHGLCEVVRGAIRCVEVRHVVFARQAHAASGCMNRIGPSAWCSAPPRATPWIKAIVLHKSREVLPVAHYV